MIDIPTYPVRDLHQVEITSRCNLRCVYCVHPRMARAKIDMTEPVYRRALHWARRFVQAGTQQSLNLAGIGESTLHPEFVRFVHLAHEAIGPRLVLATNGRPYRLCVGCDQKLLIPGWDQGAGARVA